MTRPTWPADRVEGAIAAAKQTAWREIIAAIEPAAPDLAIRYADAELAEIAEGCAWLMLTDHQLAAVLDAPWLVVRLGDAISAAYGRRIEAEVVNALRREAA